MSTNQLRDIRSRQEGAACGVLRTLLLSGGEIPVIGQADRKEEAQKEREKQKQTIRPTPDLGN